MRMLENLDRRILYIALALAILIPLVIPISLPLDVGRDATTIYQIVETLKPGDKVLFPVEFGVDSIAEMIPLSQAVMKHLMRRPGVKIVTISFNSQGHIFADRILTATKTPDRTYGTDYVNLGFVAGGESALAQFLKDIRSVAKNDYTGQPIDSFPIMKDIKSVTDFQLVIGPLASGFVGEPHYTRQMVNYRQIPFAFGTATAAYSSYVQYVQSGQIKALLPGLRGAAEYEKLNNSPGRALSGMSSQSTGHLVIVVLIVLGNIAYVYNKQKPAADGNK